MIFIETFVFSKAIQALLTDDEFRELQETLLENPSRGDRYLAVQDCVSCVGRGKALVKVVDCGRFITGLWPRTKFFWFLFTQKARWKT